MLCYFPCCFGVISLWHIASSGCWWRRWRQIWRVVVNILTRNYGELAKDDSPFWLLEEGWQTLILEITAFRNIVSGFGHPGAYENCNVTSCSIKCKFVRVHDVKVCWGGGSRRCSSAHCQLRQWMQESARPHGPVGKWSLSSKKKSPINFAVLEPIGTHLRREKSLSRAGKWKTIRRFCRQ
jgi:hypothetical protein